MDMFCYQCEQTSKGEGCTRSGVCGKDPETAALQDLLMHVIRGIASHARRAGQRAKTDPDIDAFVIQALFTTVTNVNFDPDRIEALIRQATEVRNAARTLHEQACREAGEQPARLEGPTTFEPAADRAGLVAQGIQVGIRQRGKGRPADVVGLEELCTYGLKGMAAYADHARILGKSDPEVMAFFHEALDALTHEQSVDELLALALRVGEVNLRVMSLLDEAHTSTFGHPEPTPVRITPRKGKAILVSGHDLKDLEELLKQTRGKGIHVYTHGEMLPAHAYPGLKKYDHLAGNYGGAWQDQKKEFDAFPGAILMTTNCIQKPRAGYRDRIFTCGLVAWPGVTHIQDRDFSPVIEAALAREGFDEDGEDRTILTGFGHNAVMNVAQKVVEAVKSGDVRHFFLVGGCDGARSGRSYYTELAESIPDDCVILTLACGKYRFNKLQFGDIGGIPRLLDVGQCNDAHSAIQIASALAEAFDTDVNGLPLSMVLSWYEQKAVCILLSLLHLGIRDIRLGPSLPAFVTPAVLDVLVDSFALKPVTTAREDLAAILA